jgi:hypothetical protein
MIVEFARQAEERGADRFAAGVTGFGLIFTPVFYVACRPSRSCAGVPGRTPRHRRPPKAASPPQSKGHRWRKGVHGGFDAVGPSLCKRAALRRSHAGSSIAERRMKP